MVDQTKLVEYENIIKVLEAEMECVKRQDTSKCPRFYGKTCAACDLIMDTSKVLDAYQGALDVFKAMAEEELKKVRIEVSRQDAEDAAREAWEESRYLDEREQTIKGRWGL